MSTTLESIIDVYCINSVKTILIFCYLQCFKSSNLYTYINALIVYKKTSYYILWLVKTNICHFLQILNNVWNILLKWMKYKSLLVQNVVFKYDNKISILVNSWKKNTIH
jgi:hypothetical protein